MSNFRFQFWQGSLFYPVANEDECKVALLLNINPIDLVRGKATSDRSGTLPQYVNDRPYVASSFMSVAITQVFSTALNGRCDNKPEQAEAFFNNQQLENQLLERLNTALTKSNFWQSLDTDWVCLDCEIMPWSVKAQELLRQKYAPVGVAAHAGINATYKMFAD